MIAVSVLSVSAILLGLYIIGHFLFLSSNTTLQESNLHLGCFLTEHNVSHSFLIGSSLEKLSKKSRALSVSSNHLASADLVDRKALSVAKSFELFFNEYYKQKEEQRYYVELSKAVGKAHESYRNCSISIIDTPPIIEEQCVGYWLDSEDCSSKLENLKNELSSALEEKASIEDKMSHIFQESNLFLKKNKNPQSKAEKDYRNKDRELELKEKNIETNIKLLGERIVSTEYNYAVSINETLHSWNLYKECTEHRKEFRLCEELSKEVRNLGLGTLESLAEKVEKKRNSILRIQSMINDGQNRKEKYELHSLQNRSIDEYKKLLKIFVETKAKLNKNCGCSEVEEKKLYQSMENHKNEEEILKKESIILKDKLNEETRLLNLIKEERKAIFDDFQKKLNEKSEDTNDSHEAIESLRSLEEAERSVKRKTLEYSSKFNLLENQCKSYKEELSLYLPSISKISQCLLKRDYFEYLRDSLSKQKEKLSLDFKSKNKLVEELSDFLI